MILSPPFISKRAKVLLVFFVAGFLLGGVLPAAEPAGDRLMTYPAPAGVPLNGDFSIKVRNPGGSWTNLSPYLIKVDKVISTGNRIHSAQNSSLASFDFAGTVEIAVTFNRGAIQSARVRPLSYGIQPKVAGNTMTFSLSRPRNLSVEVNGDIFHNLHLFANPMETNRPKPTDPGVIYFGPGVHEVAGKNLRVPSGKTVYLAGGAVLRGGIVIENASDVQVMGRGMTDQRPVRIANSNNIKISGIFASQIFSGGSQNVTISNTKAISCTGWGDGMDFLCCSDVLVDGVFNRNSDDCIAIMPNVENSREEVGTSPCGTQRFGRTLPIPFSSARMGTPHRRRALKTCDSPTLISSTKWSLNSITRDAWP